MKYTFFDDIRAVEKGGHDSYISVNMSYDGTCERVLMEKVKVSPCDVELINFRWPAALSLYRR